MAIKSHYGEQSEASEAEAERFYYILSYLKSRPN